jgi:adenosylcobyric acid synthase
MMGERLIDPEGHGGIKVDLEQGLGLVPGMETRFTEEKFARRRQGVVRFEEDNVPVEGYEIQTGRSSSINPALIYCQDGQEGYWNGRVMGTHLHGFFDNPQCRRAFLAPVRKMKNLPEPLAQQNIDRYGIWAEHVKSHIDWTAVERLLEAQQ